MEEGGPQAHIGSYKIERKWTRQVLLRDILRNHVFEGRLADSSGKCRVSAGPVITGSRERRNRDHTQSGHPLYGMLEGVPAREEAGRCYGGQWGGMCDTWQIWSVTQCVALFVLYCVFPAFVWLHASLHISQYLLGPARFTLCVWLVAGCWPLPSLEEPLLLYVFVNGVYSSQGSTAETGLEARC